MKKRTVNIFEAMEWVDQFRSDYKAWQDSVKEHEENLLPLRLMMSQKIENKELGDDKVD